MINVLSRYVSHNCVHAYLVDDVLYCILYGWEDLGPVNIGIDFVILDGVTSEIVNWYI